MVHHDHHHDKDDALASDAIPNVTNETAVEQALNTDRAVQDQSYVQKVIESYVENKNKQGDSAEDISKKLVYVLQRFPHFKAAIDKVVNEKGLPKLAV